MRKFLYMILLSIVTSCSGQVLDLSTINIGKSVNNYNLDKLNPSKKYEQKGHYEVKRNGEEVSLDLVDNGEKVINYFFDLANVKQLNYMGYPLEKTTGGFITTFNGNIEHLHCTFLQKQSNNLLKTLFEKFGTPTDISYNSRMEKSLNKGAVQIMKKEIPKYITRFKSEFGNIEIKYPERIYWKKDNILYKLEIMPYENQITSSLFIISKKAFKDRIIFGYHLGEKDETYIKYMK